MSHAKVAPRIAEDDPRVVAILAVDPKVSMASVRRVLSALDEGYDPSPDVAGKTIELDGSPGMPVTWGALEDTHIMVGRNVADSIVAIGLPDNAVIADAWARYAR